MPTDRPQLNTSSTTIQTVGSYESLLPDLLNLVERGIDLPLDFYPNNDIIDSLNMMRTDGHLTPDEQSWARVQMERLTENIERRLLREQRNTILGSTISPQLVAHSWQEYSTPVFVGATTSNRNTRQNDRVCRFCQETITPNPTNACQECSAESSHACYLCHASIPEGQANSVCTSYDNYEVLCRSCYGNRVHCTSCSNLIGGYDPSLNDCLVCHRAYCTTDITTHSCNHNMSMPYRPYSRNKFKGHDLLAKSIKINRLVGVELEAVNGNPSKIGGVLNSNIGISDDGSLKGRNGIELQTPASSCNELETYIENATTTLKEAEYKTNKSCGLHIHIDGSDFSKNGRKIFQLLNTYYIIEPIILSMLPKSRRNNVYAMPLKRWFSQLKIQELISNKRMSIKRIEQEWYKTKNTSELNRYKRNKYDNSRYHGLNLHALLSGGHYEIRYHQGTINQKKITNWINFHLAILDWALKDYSKEALDNIDSETDMNTKARKMNRYFKFDKNTRRYVRKQIRKFNSIDEEPEE